MTCKNLLAVSALCLAPLAAHADDAADRAAIEAVVQAYFDGIGAADAARLDKAFAAENAAMVGLVKTRDGGSELKSWKDMSAVVANWAANEGPEGAGRDGEILQMTVTDERIAMVMFRYKDEYYDALTLLKVDGAWKIATKTFVER
ncbi:MAG: nuclear transport factor 2 family protein [Parvularculaceae bacterium]